MKRIAILSLLFIISVTVFGQYLRTDGTNVMTEPLRIRRESSSSIELESNTAAYIDFKHSQSADYNGRIIWNYNNSNWFDIYGRVNFRSDAYMSVLDISNEMRVPNAFSANDPSIGSIDNLGYGLNISSTSGIGFALNNSHRMVILPSGNVGIGTSIPNSKLEVGVSHVYNQDEEMRIGSYYQNKFIGVGLNYRIDDVGACSKHLVAYHGGVRATLMTFNHDNKIGIGTDSPIGKLDVRGSLVYARDANVKTIMHCSGDGNSYFNYSGAPTNSRIGFQINNQSKMSIMENGNVGIGKLPSNAKLDVAGNIKAQEIEVTLASMEDLQLNGTLAANNITYTTNGQTADHVFEGDYKLRELSEVEAFITKNKHLPDVPSAAAMEEQGVNLAEMNKLLLQKVEELTLYAIEQKAEVERQKAEVKKQVEQVRREESEAREELEKEVDELKKMVMEMMKSNTP